MKILVTGAAGFIGSNLCDRFRELGHSVVGVDNLSTGNRANLVGVPLHEVDVASPELEEVVKSERPDVVCHHAAQIDVRKSVSDPVEDIRCNAIGTVRVAQASANAGVRRVLFASTGGAIYGEQQVYPAAEDHPTDPLSPYGCSKLFAEKYLNTLAVDGRFELVILRYANVYGPRQSAHGEAGVVAIFAERLLSGRPLTINGDGLQSRDFVFVSDVVDANVKALTTESPGIYNVGTGVERTVVDVYNGLARAAGHEGPPAHGPAKAGEQRRSVLDAARARRVLGWAPRVDLDEGLALTMDWFRANRK